MKRSYKKSVGKRRRSKRAGSKFPVVNSLNKSFGLEKNISGSIRNPLSKAKDEFPEFSDDESDDEEPVRGRTPDPSSVGSTPPRAESPPKLTAVQRLAARKADVPAEHDPKRSLLSAKNSITNYGTQREVRGTARKRKSRKHKRKTHRRRR